MSDDLERELRESLAAAASAAIGDHRQPPPFDPARDVPVPATGRRRMWLAPLLAAAAVVAVVTGSVVAVNAFSRHRSAVAGPAGPATAGQSGPSTAPTRVVRVHSVEGDGSTYGVAMPIVLQFDARPTDVRAFEKAVTVTVNGRPAGGAWYWEKSTTSAFAVEAHYRQQNYWPADATIRVQLPIAGLPAGPGMVYGDKLTSVTFRTGPAMIGYVDGGTSQLTIMQDGRNAAGPFPVALGSPKTPTMNGVKVVMEKLPDVAATTPGASIEVKSALRLTASGEYLYAAPWNVMAIEQRRPTSNGCTDLLPDQASTVFKMLQIGDPVVYTNMPGSDVKTVPATDGYGDWNVPWSTWLTGGPLH